MDDYSALSKKELIPEKQQKAFDRVKNFRDELGDYRGQFDRLRREREEAVRFYAGCAHGYWLGPRLWNFANCDFE